MKKFKINLVMIAIIIGTTGAFAFKAPKHRATAQTNYYWFAYDDNGNIIDPSQEPTLGADPFGCSGSNNLCAAGYTEPPVRQPDGTWAPQGSPSQTDLKP